MSKSKKPKYRTMLGLVMMYLATFLEWDWMWGILYLYWVIPDLFIGKLFFIEAIDRRDHPVLFWTTAITFLLLSLYVFLEPLFFRTAS